MDRVDTHAIRLAYPLAAVAARYGVALQRHGQVLMGCCPLHDDHTPSFLVDERDQHFHCYGCGAHGDVIDLVRRLEGLDFVRAVSRLAGGRPLPCGPPVRLSVARRRRGRNSLLDAEAERCLAAAVELYRNQLLAEPVALAYLAGRGLEPPTLARWRVGYAAGGTLSPYLRWRGRSVGAAQRAGLLDGGGHERMTGRVVIPEFLAARPCWMIGRRLDTTASPAKYLGLPGRKPLLGAERAGDTAVTVVEGVLDLLVLDQWGVPAVALAGTHASAEQLAALCRFERVYLTLDADAPGQQATAVLERSLGERARSVAIPGGAKDVADLATQPDGRAAFLQALRSAELPAAA